MYTIKLCYVLYSTYCEIPWPRSIRCTFRCDALNISVISRLHRYPSLPQLLFEVVDIPRNQGFRKKTEPNSVRNSVRRAMVQILLVTQVKLGWFNHWESPPTCRMVLGGFAAKNHREGSKWYSMVDPLNGWPLPKISLQLTFYRFYIYPSETKKKQLTVPIVLGLLPTARQTIHLVGVCHRFIGVISLLLVTIRLVRPQLISVQNPLSSIYFCWFIDSWVSLFWTIIIPGKPYDKFHCRN